MPERIRAVLGGSAMQSRVVEIVATEASLFYYAFAAWRRRPFVPSSARAFSYHKRNSLAAIFYTLCIASAVETGAVHFLLRAVAPRAAVVARAQRALDEVLQAGRAARARRWTRPSARGNAQPEIVTSSRNKVSLPVPVE